MLLDSTHPDPQVREKVYEHIAQDALVQACALVGKLARPAEEEQQYQQLLGKYATVRTFLPTLLRTVTFQATPAGRPILEAVTFLTPHEGRKSPSIDEAPRKVIARGWQRHAISREGKEEHIDRKAYTLCVVERFKRLFAAMRCLLLRANDGLIRVRNFYKERPGRPCVDRSVKRLGVL